MAEDTATVEAGEQQALFPELDDANPAHKELMKRARKYAKEKVQRDELLKTNKDEVDGLMEKVLEQMHACDLKKFKHESTTYELVAGREKVKLKIDTSDDARGKKSVGLSESALAAVLELCRAANVAAASAGTARNSMTDAEVARRFLTQTFTESQA